MSDFDTLLNLGKQFLDSILPDRKSGPEKLGPTLHIINIKTIYCTRCGYSKGLNPGDTEPTMCPACGRGGYSWHNQNQRNQ